MLVTTFVKISLVSVLKGPTNDAPSLSEAEKATFLSVNITKQKLLSVIEVEVLFKQQGKHFSLNYNCFHHV